MRLIILLIFPFLVSAQNHIGAEMDGNQLCIFDIENPQSEWYQYHVQNKDSFSENFSFWSKSTDTCIISPYCNTKVRRVAFDGTDPIASNVVEVNQANLSVKVWWNGKLNIELKGGFDEVGVTMWNIYGGQIFFQEDAVFSEEGHKELNPVMRHRGKNQPRLVRFSYIGGNCQGVITKLIYI